MNAKEQKQRAALLARGPFAPGTRRVITCSDEGLDAISYDAARVLNADYFTCVRYRGHAEPGVALYERNVHASLAAACADALAGAGRGMVYVVHTVNGAERSAHLDREDWPLFQALLDMAKAGTL